jgi:hypothetical protein
VTVDTQGSGANILTKSNAKDKPEVSKQVLSREFLVNPDHLLQISGQPIGCQLSGGDGTDKGARWQFPFPHQINQKICHLIGAAIFHSDNSVNWHPPPLLLKMEWASWQFLHLKLSGSNNAKIFCLFMKMETTWAAENDCPLN